MRHHTKFCMDQSNRCRDMAVRRCSSAILDLFRTCLDHPQSILIGLYRCAKRGWNLGFERYRYWVLANTCQCWVVLVSAQYFS